ncbi:unnamed protein product [Mytilus coruscus]|uniref:Uncharacterized protein n=1 Tax=Mytilus coruscus TaxID=42192 RepID=A0A6J8ACL3_MYTCO|nr:unnamed protein product [Mytilus coruscus]
MEKLMESVRFCFKKPKLLKIQSRLQRGFTDGVNSTFAALPLTEAIIEPKELGQTLYTTFVDASTAFGVVWHASISKKDITKWNFWTKLVNCGVIGGIGGVTIGNSLMKDNVLSKQSKSIAKRELDRYSAASEIAKRRCLKISLQLQKKGEIEDHFPEWTKFWCRIAHGQENSNEQQKTNWKETKNIIETNRFEIQSTSRFLGEGIRAGIRIAGVAARITGTSLHVAGGFIGVQMIPPDIHTLVTSVNDERKKINMKLPQ